MGNFPTSKLATFATAYLKLGTFESYFTLYPTMNAYDPIKQEDEYVEYLLYSWARGKAGYVYNNLNDYGPLGRHPQ